MERSHVLGMARKLRDDYSDEIPGEVLDSVTDNRGYKCRNAWFTSVCNMTDNAVAAGVVGGDISSGYRNFQAHLKETGFHDRLTDEDDIAKGNDLLDLVIGECSFSVGERLKGVFSKR